MNALSRQIVGPVLNRLYRNGPRSVNIESTSHCNARCITCPHPMHQRVQGIMDPELYRKVLKECVDLGVKKLHLQNFGEPLIDKMLPDRIRAAKKQGIETVKIISNGSILTDEKARALIDAGLDEIKISFDGLSKEVFEKVRAGLHYDRVVSNIENLLHRRDESGNSTPRVQLMFVSIEENEFEQEGFVDRWRGVADRVDVTRAHNWGGSEDVATSTAPKQATGYPCLRLWQTLTVLWDGRVSICCLDYEGSQIVGDLRHQTIREIWAGPRLADIRRWHERGKFDRVPICANCTAR